MAHFDIKKQIAGKHLVLTDYLNRNPVSKPKSIEKYDEEYVINYITLLMEFINDHDSIVELRKKEIRTDNSEKREQKFNHSQASYKNKPKASENKTNDHSLLLSSQQPVLHVNLQQSKEDNETITDMDIKEIEQIERQDPSAETSALTNRWKKLKKTEQLQDVKWRMEEI